MKQNRVLCVFFKIVDGLSISALFAKTSRKVSEKSLKQIANGKNFLKRLKKHPIPYTFKVPFSDQT